MSTPNASEVRTAQLIAANPERYAPYPEAFATAWILLKHARGQSVDTVRIGQPMYDIRRARFGTPLAAQGPHTPLCQLLNQAAPRLSQRIAQRAGQLGLILKGGAA